MELDKITGVVNVILFIVPGFVAHFVYSTVISTRAQDEKTRILSAIVASAWLYGFISPVIYLVFKYGWYLDHPYLFSTCLFATLFLYPVVAGYLCGRLQHSQWSRKALTALKFRHPSPRAWDHVFQTGTEFFILATLTDGTKIGGHWHASSFAGDDALGSDLYLATQYKLGESGEFLHPLEFTGGCYIEQRNVLHLEFYQVHYDQGEKEKSDDHKGPERLRDDQEGVPALIESADRACPPEPTSAEAKPVEAAGRIGGGTAPESSAV